MLSLKDEEIHLSGILSPLHMILCVAGVSFWVPMTICATAFAAKCPTLAFAVFSLQHQRDVPSPIIQADPYSFWLSRCFPGFAFFLN